MDDVDAGLASHVRRSENSLSILLTAPLLSLRSYHEHLELTFSPAT